MTPEQFRAALAPIAAAAEGQPLDMALADRLNRQFPANGPVYKSIVDGCRAAIASGWMCNREAGGIKFGRVVKAAPEMHGFSIDVVDMNEVVGPHHKHPNGEIDLVMPLEGDAKFDGHGAGFVVYPPGSAHKPTVKGGRALVLYLLPQGAIEFTQSA